MYVELRRGFACRRPLFRCDTTAIRRNLSLYRSLTLEDGTVFRVKARSAVMAGGSWTTKHIVEDLPGNIAAAYAQFYRSPCMMANVAVRNWRLLHKMGISGCRWFEGFGNYMDVCRQAVVGINDESISPDSPIVLAVKVLYSYPGLSTEEQGHRGRGEMLATSFREYERRIREQFTLMFGATGFDASRDIAGIVLNRWGHAYLSPQPGFFFGKDGNPAPREILAKRSIWPHRFCEYGSRRRHGPSLLDPGSATCGRPVGGSSPAQLNAW